MNNLNWILIVIAAVFALVSYLVKDKEDKAGTSGVGIGLALAALITTLIQLGK